MYNKGRPPDILMPLPVELDSPERIVHDEFFFTTHVTPNDFRPSNSFNWQNFFGVDDAPKLPYVDPNRGTQIGKVDSTVTSALSKYRGNIVQTGRRRRVRG